MVLYQIFKNYKTVIEDQKLPESKADIVNLSTSEIQVCSHPNSDENVHDQTDHDVKCREASKQELGQLSDKCEVWLTFTKFLFVLFDFHVPPLSM